MMYSVTSFVFGKPEAGTITYLALCSHIFLRILNQLKHVGQAHVFSVPALTGKIRAYILSFVSYEVDYTGFMCCVMGRPLIN